MDVSVTIANWNRADLLEKCLRSIFATPPAVQYEVIVVDNASSDNSVVLVPERFPQARLIVNPQNVGFGRAHNQAIAVAHGRYILVLNSDTEIWPDTIPTLIQFMDDHVQAGACGCPDYRQTVLSTFMAGACRQFPTLTRTVLENLWCVFRPPMNLHNYWGLRQLRRKVSGDLADFNGREVAWIAGALLMLRREAFETIGGFDEAFFLFTEETDLCRRLWAAGWKVFFTTATSYAHRGGASSELRTDIEQLRGESGTKYFRKHHGWLAALLFRGQHYVLRRCVLQWRIWVGKRIFRLP